MVEEILVYEYVEATDDLQLYWCIIKVATRLEDHSVQINLYLNS